jgi:hypothetical protein
MARQVAARPVRRPVRPNANNHYRACRCGHLKHRFLDQRVVERIGERSSTHTAEQFDLMYQVSPCKGWPFYKSAAREMGIPIPGGGGVFEESSSEEESEEENEEENEEESQEESQEEERPLPRLPDAVVPRLTSTNERANRHRTFTEFMASGATGNAAFAAFIASGASGATGKDALAVFIASGGASNTRPAATAATDSSKKLKTGAEEKGLDNRPAWKVRMEREQPQSSSSVDDKADHPRTPSVAWGKPQSTASRLAPSKYWGKPQSTEPTEPTSTNKWTYPTFKNNW